MNGINDLPGDSDFGLDFNYQAWDSVYSELTLCNVPWDNSYRDVAWFDSYNDLNSYLESGSHWKGVDFEYLKPNDPVIIDMPLNRASLYNYVHVKNTAPGSIGDAPRDLYYFIIGVNWKAPHSTELVLQLDAWQTWIRNMRFGRCFLKQGHWGFKTQYSTNAQIRQRYLSTAEGMDTGSEYQIRKTRRHGLASSVEGGTGTGLGQTPAITVISNVELDIDGGTVESPKFTSARGGSMEGLPTASSIYIFANATLFQQAIGALSDKPWMTQGIVSITAMPKIDMETASTSVGGVTCQKVLNVGTIKHQIVDMNALRTQANNTSALFGTRYAQLDKFRNYPYSLIELTTNEGQPLILKPELWGDDWKVVILSHMLPPNQRIAILPYRYNSRTDDADLLSSDANLVSDASEWLDMATFISNFPQFTVLNNGAIAYLANNANSLAYQQQQNDWSQSKALASNQLGYDQASNSIDTSTQLANLAMNTATAQTNLSNDVATQKTVINGISSVAGGTLSGAAGGLPGMAAGALGGLANAAMGGIDTAINVNAANQGLAISNANIQQQNSIGSSNASYNRDTNKTYADWAARGDYQSAQAAYNAKIQDSKMIQPSTVGQLGGNAFNMAKYMMGFDLKLKTIPPSAIQAIGEYWLNYGYAWNEWINIPSNFQVMTYFTYWKLSETFIRSSTAPEHMKQTIRGILESGVRVWGDADNIGLIDPANNYVLP